MNSLEDELIEEESRESWYNQGEAVMKEILEDN